VAYPLVPWIGVMAAGYGFGAMLLRPPDEKRRLQVLVGLGLISAFIFLRALDIYGDPQPWSSQGNTLFTIFSVVNCDKYPPSLLFLLMTLGPSILSLALFDLLPRPITRPLVVFGRVPLFYYLLHLPLIHALAVVFSYLRYGRAGWLFQNPPSKKGPPFPLPDGYGYGLPMIYAIWLGVVLILFLACLWFSKVKQRRRDPWLSYL
jgi:uncharacterized membrane protein